jgi:hypothetical protein
MLATTADTAGIPIPATDASETRPVRLLVPTVRRNDYWLSPEDTLRASDLGVTRHTSDEELDGLVDAAADLLVAVSSEDPATWLRRIRDMLRSPRDIAEAHQWGFIVPREENIQEFDTNARKRLGWWMVYDPKHTETRAQRRARYLADQRLIDMKGFARVLGRAYITVKDLKFEADEIRRILENEEYRLEKAAELATELGVSVEEAAAQLRAKADEDILKAMPVRRDRAGQSDLWFVSDAMRNGRDNTRLDEWYERNTIRQSGRPKGSRTKNRRAPAAK